MTVQKVKQSKKRKKKRKISENKWIHLNLNRAKEMDGGKPDFINQKGRSTNSYEDEEIIQLLKREKLVRGVSTELFVTDKGNIVIRKFNGWLPYKRKVEKDKILKQKEETEIQKLQKRNLELQNKIMKNRIVSGVIGAFAALALSEWRGILKFLLELLSK